MNASTIRKIVKIKNIRPVQVRKGSEKITKAQAKTVNRLA